MENVEIFKFAGEDLAVGDPVYFNGEYWMKAKADKEETYCTDIVRVPSLAFNLCPVLLTGFVQNENWNFKEGSTLYLSAESAGVITDIKPETEKVQSVGYAVSNNKIFFSIA